VFAEFGVLNFWTYVVGAFFIVLVPGPNTLFVLKTGIGHGVKKAISPRPVCLSAMRF
jgi:leucine efflux protein